MRREEHIIEHGQGQKSSTEERKSCAPAQAERHEDFNALFEYDGTSGLGQQVVSNCSPQQPSFSTGKWATYVLDADPDAVIQNYGET